MIVCQVPGDSLSGARCQVQLIDLCHVVPFLVLEEVLYGSCLPLDPGGGASPGGLVTVAEQAGVPGGQVCQILSGIREVSGTGMGCSGILVY